MAQSSGTFLVVDPQAAGGSTPTLPPITAGVLSVTDFGQDFVTLSLTSTTGGTGNFQYVLQSGPAAGGPWTNVTLFDATATDVTDNNGGLGLPANTFFAYRVWVTDTAQSSAFSNVVTQKTAAAPAKDPLSLFAPSIVATSPTSATLMIAAATGGSGTGLQYKLQVSPVVMGMPTGAWTDVNLYSSSRTVVSSGLSNGAYAWRFLARDDASDTAVSPAVIGVLVSPGLGNYFPVGFYPIGYYPPGFFPDTPPIVVVLPPIGPGRYFPVGYYPIGFFPIGYYPDYSPPPPALAPGLGISVPDYILTYETPSTDYGVGDAPAFQWTIERSDGGLVPVPKDGVLTLETCDGTLISVTPIYTNPNIPAPLIRVGAVVTLPQHGLTIVRQDVSLQERGGPLQVRAACELVAVKAFIDNDGDAGE